MGWLAPLRAIAQDLRRENPGVSVVSVVSVRLLGAGRRCPAPVRVLLLPVTVPAWIWLSLCMCAEIPGSAEIGPGLRLPHGGRCVLIHPDCRIGARATIFHGVTIGQRGPGGPPVLGDDVYVGTGALLLGPITVGDGAKIGAGAVVVSDVGPGERRVGMPQASCEGSRPARAGVAR